jgi:acyl-CoA dehydrogenase
MACPAEPQPIPPSTWQPRPVSKACETAVMTLGGFGYAKEYHVERYFREILITRIAPISPQLILCYIAERVLGLPKSY